MTRYILAELLKTFGVVVILLTCLLIVSGVVQTVMVHGITFVHMARLLPFIFVEMSRVSVPMTLLLVTTTFFSRMAGNNEIVALKSAGVAPWKVILPALGLGLAVSLLSVWLNDLAVTWGRAGIAHVIFNGMEDSVLNKLRTHGAYQNDDLGVSIRVQGIDYKRLIAPTIVLRQPPTTISAETAEIHIDTNAEELRLVLNKFVIDVSNTAHYEGERDEQRLSLSKYFPRGDEMRRPSEMGMGRLRSERTKEETTIASRQRQQAALMAFGVANGRLESLGSSEFAGASRLMEQSQRRIDQLAVETPRRWAAGFSCLVFVWIGAPLAIWMRKSDILASFYTCFIPILLIYYPLMELGKEWAKSGATPPISVWLGNVVLLGVGCWFLKRIHRY